MMEAARNVKKKDVQPESAQSDKILSAGKEDTKAPGRFLKEQLAKSARYAGRRDLVEALLDSGRSYTIEEVENIIAEYLHGKER